MIKVIKSIFWISSNYGTYNKTLNFVQGNKRLFVQQLFFVSNVIKYFQVQLDVSVSSNIVECRKPFTTGRQSKLCPL